MKSILKEHVGQQIGVNVKRPFHIDAVQLVAVHDEYFSVSLEKKDDLYHIPYTSIERIVENPDGVLVGGLFHQKQRYPLVVKVGHIVEHVVG